MTRSNMRGLLHRAATAALLTLLPSAAWAQIGTNTPGTAPGQTTTNPTGTNAIDLNLTVTRQGDSESIENGQFVYARKADCDRNFEFRVRYSQPVPVVEAWLGVGLNCADPANRVLTGNVASAVTKCRKLQVERNQLELRMVVPGLKMFDDNGDNVCDAAVKGTPYTIYIIALERETNPEAQIASEPWLPAGVVRSVKAAFTPYLALPKPPVEVTALPGEARLGITFEAEPNFRADTQTTFKAYFDVGTGGGTLPCGSGLLEQNATPGNNAAGLRSTKRGRNRTVYLSDVEDIPIGSSVAASAVMFDAAGNESPPSPPICVERVETTGFQDFCANDPSCRGSLDSCSLSFSRRNGGLSLGLLVLTALVLGRRRRRST